MRLRSLIASGGFAAAINLMVIFAAGKLLDDSSTAEFFSILMLAIVLLPIVEFGIVEYLIHKKAFPSTYFLFQSFIVLGVIFYISSVLKSGGARDVFVVLLYVYSLLASRFVFGLGQLTSNISLVFFGQFIPQVTKAAALVLVLVGLDIIYTFLVAGTLNLLSLYLVRHPPLVYERKLQPFSSTLLIFGATSLVILLLQRFDLIIAQENLSDREFNTYFLLSNLIIGVQILTRSMLTKNLADLSTLEDNRQKSIKMIISRQMRIVPLAILVVIAAAFVPGEILALLLDSSGPNVKLCMIALLLIQMVGLVLSPLEAIFIRYRPIVLLYQKGTAATLYVLGFAIFAIYSSFGLVEIAVIAFVARLFGWALLVFFIVNFIGQIKYDPAEE